MKILPDLARLFPATALLVCLGCGQTRVPILDLPPRSSEAPVGSEFSEQIRAMDRDTREERIFSEIAGGNVPTFLRKLARVQMTREIDGQEHLVEFWATRDYLSVGSDTDFFLVPLSPGIAQRLADLVNCSLPTVPMVDAIWTAADKLDPTPIPPSPEMTSVPVFQDHDRLVRMQRSIHSARADAMVAGHKKDVVITQELASRQGNVAIYGWHRRDGIPIQPLYVGHTDTWVDYSHGIRLVYRNVVIDGIARDISEVLRDPTLASLLSDEGTIDRARY